MVEDTIEIHVNGAPRPVPTGSTVADLVASLELRPDEVAVEVNRDLVPRAVRAERPLVPGDRVELVTLVGGG